MQRLLSVFLVITIFFSLAGCKLISTPGISSSGSESSEVTSAQKEKEYVIEEAKRYLKEKYPDDEFTYNAARSPSWGFEYYEVRFTSALFSDAEISVYLWNTDDTHGNVITENSKDYGISDSYYTCKFKEEGIEYFDDLLSSYGFTDYRLDIGFPNVLGPSENIDASKGFVYYYKEDTLGFFLFLYTKVDIDKFEDKITELLSTLKDEGHDMWLEYIHVDVLPSEEKMKDSSEMGEIVKESIEQVIYSTAYEEENNFRGY